MANLIKIDLKTIATSIVVVLILWVTYLILYPVTLGSEAKVIIPEGTGAKGIAQILSENKLIRNEYVFLIYVSALGEDRNMKAGEYKFSGKINMNGVVSILSGGLSEKDDIEVTIPEGLNVWEIDQKLEKSGLISAGDFSSKYYMDEGYLFPDTYKLKNKDGRISITELRDKMRNNFINKVFGTHKSLSENDGSYLVIASILEKEAKTENDMRLVAGIIQKRLSKDMPLEVDASVVYGACLRESAKSEYTEYCDVTFQGPAKEIKIDSPYNTYMRKGLPAGPISNPRLKAI